MSKTQYVAARDRIGQGHAIVEGSHRVRAVDPTDEILKLPQHVCRLLEQGRSILRGLLALLVSSACLCSDAQLLEPLLCIRAQRECLRQLHQDLPIVAVYFGVTKPDRAAESWFPCCASPALGPCVHLCTAQRRGRQPTHGSFATALRRPETDCGRGRRWLGVCRRGVVCSWGQGNRRVGFADRGD